jgi:hypothetical protein
VFESWVFRLEVNGLRDRRSGNRQIDARVVEVV